MISFICGSRAEKQSSIIEEGFSGGASGKDSTCNAGDVRDAGSIPESGRSLEKGMATHFSILAWRIPQTGGLSP